MDIFSIVIALFVGAAGAAGGFFVSQQKAKDSEKAATGRGNALLKEAEQRAATLELDAKNRAEKIAAESEKLQAAASAEKERAEKGLEGARAEAANMREKLDAAAEDIREKERQQLARETRLDEKETKLDAAKASLEAAEKEASEKTAAAAGALERAAALSKEEAKKELLAAIEKENGDLIAKKIAEGDRLSEAAFEERARGMIANAIQRLASEVSGELTASLVPLPNDDLKGKIIGREGRNITAFEMATGVDVVVDDTPGAVIISGFDLVRREIAKRALARLIKDGRMHPARIEEEVAKQRAGLDREIEKMGADAAAEVGVLGLPKEIHYLLGRLNFRTSYGQNNLKHAKEVARIGAMLATELGADVAISKAACLVHDLGKALTHEIEGPHALISGEQLRKYGVDERIAAAAEAHHEDVPIETIEAQIVQAADAISGARVGARSETSEEYIQRLKDIERIATTEKGVEKAFAIAAGRELRVFVKPQEIDDIGSLKTARAVANKIEKDLSYPGQVKVTVIRETRAVEYAK